MVLLYHDGISDRVLLSCSVCCDFWPGVGRLSALTSLFFLFVTLDTTEEELIGCLVTPSGIFNSIFSLKASHVPHSLIMCVFSFFVSSRCVCKQSGVDAESDGARAQSGEFRALKGRGSPVQESSFSGMAYHYGDHFLPKLNKNPNKQTTNRNIKEIYFLNVEIGCCSGEQLNVKVL